MKYILRTAVGVWFTFFLLLFLFINAVKFDLLSSRFWTSGFEKSGMYQEIALEVGKLQSQIDRQVGRGRIKLSEAVSEARLRETVETNVERLVTYLNGTTNSLAFSLPLRDWGLPREIISGLPKLNWSTEMEVEAVMTEMGMKPEQRQEVLKALSQIQMISSKMIWIWLGLLLALLGLFAAHFALGEGKKEKVSGSGGLLVFAGLLVALIGWGGGKIGEAGIGSINEWPVWTKTLASGLVTEFFSLGKTIGLGVELVGLVIWAWVAITYKKGKEKEAKQKIGLVKKIIFTVLGVTLGLVAMVAVIGGVVVLFGGQVSVGLQTTGS